MSLHLPGRREDLLGSVRITPRVVQWLVHSSSPFSPPLFLLLLLFSAILLRSSFVSVRHEGLSSFSAAGYDRVSICSSAPPRCFSAFGNVQVCTGSSGAPRTSRPFDYDQASDLFIWVDHFVMPSRPFGNEALVSALQRTCSSWRNFQGSASSKLARQSQLIRAVGSSNLCATDPGSSKIHR